MLVLAVFLTISYGFLFYNIRVMSLDQNELNSIYQERELYLSKFYNSINKDALIKELYVVTKDGKYLDAMKENTLSMHMEYDSLYRYCLANDAYCRVLDSIQAFLLLFEELLIPQYEQVHHSLTSGKDTVLELAELSESEGQIVFGLKTLRSNEYTRIQALLDQNHEFLRNKIMEPAEHIVSSDRQRTKAYRGQMNEKISLYNLWQKVVIILTLGLVALLLFFLVFITLRPLEKPQPVYSKLPDQNYVVPYKGFENDLIFLLGKHEALFLKYEAIILVLPKGGLFPMEIISGLRNFCEDHKLPFLIRDMLLPEDMGSGKAFVLLEDQTLAYFVEMAQEKNLVIGQHTGILAYGDSPLKRIVADGISVIENLTQDCPTASGRIKNEASSQPCLRFIERNSL
jgi:hypothetical protein